MRTSAATRSAEVGDLLDGQRVSRRGRPAAGAINRTNDRAYHAAYFRSGVVRRLSMNYQVHAHPPALTRSFDLSSDRID
jgi:hypothetical protein